MARVIERTVYSYAELEERAKERAREWWLRDYDFAEEINQFHFWGGFLGELADAGFYVDTRRIPLHGGTYREEAAIFWNGYHWEVYFSASVDVRKFLRHRKLAGKLRTIYNHGDNIRADVAETDRQCARAGTEVAYGPDDEAAWLRLDAQCAILEREILHFYHEITSRMAQALADEYDYQTSEEAIAEMMAINEYEFTADGEWV